ncbi:tail tubular protein A [Carp edema virus]|nr:tail tubular protein A [Carp edema virus]
MLIQKITKEEIKREFHPVQLLHSSKYLYDLITRLHTTCDEKYLGDVVFVANAFCSDKILGKMINIEFSFGYHPMLLNNKPTFVVRNTNGYGFVTIKTRPYDEAVVKKMEIPDNKEVDFDRRFGINHYFVAVQPMKKLDRSWEEMTNSDSLLGTVEKMSIPIPIILRMRDVEEIVDYMDLFVDKVLMQLKLQRAALKS